MAIRTGARSPRGVSPRVQALGWPRPWIAARPPTGRIDAGPIAAARATRLPAPALSVARPAALPLPAPLPASAVSVPLTRHGASTPAVSLLTGGASETVRGTSASLSHTNRTAARDTRGNLVERLSAVLQPPAEAIFAATGTLDWPAPLLPYQREGVRALLERRELLLADDMGLGKTIQAIAALRILFWRNEIESALVVCPASLLVQWSREFRKWAPELTLTIVRGTAADRGIRWRQQDHVKLVGYETLRGDVLDLADSPALRNEWSVVVLDEASKIKNAETGVSRACKLLPRNRRWALTGTPVENAPDDLVSLLQFLAAQPGERSAVPRDGALLKEELARVQLRRKKADVLLDLPPKLVVEQFIDLQPRQREAYDQAERDGIVRLTAAGEAVTITHVLELIVRLKQICNCDPASGESAKLVDIEDRLETLVEEGHRAVVFSQFTGPDFGIELIEGRLARFSPVTYTGALSIARRAAAVDEFVRNDRHKVIAVSLLAGGMGLNLQAASYVFHLDRWWNPAREDQAEARAHRMGQAFPVTAIRYICCQTIEERIHERLAAKRSLFRDLVDDVSLDLRSALSEAELFGLFGLTPHGSDRVNGRDKARFHEMSGEDFERWLAAALTRVGFHVELTPGSADGGIDIVARRSDELRVETELIIQCKNQSAPVGVPVVRELRGVVPDRRPGVTPVVASPAGFTAEARRFAEEHGVRLWSEPDLTELAKQADRDTTGGTGARAVEKELA